MLTLRLLENWRPLTPDPDLIIVLVAVAAISGEKLTRTSLSRDTGDLGRRIASDRLGYCNVSSVAAATGLNRETARRKVSRLVEAGVLVRRDDRSITFNPDVAQAKNTMELVEKQLDIIRRTTNELIRDGALRLRAHT